MPAEDSLRRSQREAVRRARRCVRELVFDYDLRLLWTFTFADAPVDRQQMLTESSALGRQLRAKVPQLLRLIVPEQSPTGRWHLHMAVPVEVDDHVMIRLWGKGEVAGPDMRQALSDGALDKMSTYLTKSFDDTPKGARRYLPSAGLRPIAHRFTAPSAAAALAIACDRLGGQPLHADWYSGNFMAFFTPATNTGGAL